MCISPIKIKNPNLGRTDSFAQFKDCSSQYIEVPCGHCSDCVSHRQLQFVQRLQAESLVNHFFFCTLTYNNDMMPKVTTSTGYDLRYADVSDVQNMFKRLRKRNAFGRPFRHFSVSELGSSKGRPHFHILFLIPKYDGDDFNDCLNLEKLLFNEVLSEWKRNVASPVWSKKKNLYVPNVRFPVYKPLCTYVCKMVYGKLRRNFDLHYVNPLLSSGQVADVAFYVLKYMMKPSDRLIRLQRALHLNLSEQEYDDIWSLVKTRHFESEGLGLGVSGFDVVSDNRKLPKIHPTILSHLRKGIDLSKSMPSPVPSFISVVDGTLVPLADYYKSLESVYNMSDFLDFFYSSDRPADNVIIKDDFDATQTDIKISKFEKNQNLVDFQDSAVELDDLFDCSNDLFLDF